MTLLRPRKQGGNSVQKRPRELRRLCGLLRGIVPHKLHSSCGRDEGGTCVGTAVVRLLWLVRGESRR